jgi:serine/threonine-protein kinase HipA
MDYDLEVYVDPSGSPILVGRLWLREKTTTFQYDSSWLARSTAFALAPALILSPGPFHSDAEDGIFGPFRDAAPDRWGKKLMRHREHDRARDAKTKGRSLFSGDYLVGVDDETRIGALRFKETGSSKPFLSQSNNPVPFLLELSKLVGAANRLERDRGRRGDLALLLAPGGSLGGARPKANVREKDGRLHIAKFPWAQKDEWLVVFWEAVSLDLAGSAGIKVPDWRLIPIPKNVVLLLGRFDRRSNSQRVPFMSAMTALGAKDHDERSYMEIADVLRQIGEAPEEDICQLWRRMVFNVLISNTDDHPRNHALLRGGSGWRLSPAYDMNPNPLDGDIHVMAFNEDEHAGSLALLLSVSEYFGINLATAKQIAAEVAAAVKDWLPAVKRMERAGKITIGKPEIEKVSSAFKADEIKTALSYRISVGPPEGRKQKKKQKKVAAD